MKICNDCWVRAVPVAYECINVSVPSADAALPPASAASNDVALTVKTLTGSVHLTVLRAFPLE